LEVLSALSHSFERIIIGVTNPDLANLQAHSASAHRHTDGANPFSFEARVEIIKNSITGIQKLDLSAVQIDIVPFDLTKPDSWKVPAQTVFAVRIFSPWEASKLSLFTDQGFETLQLPAPDSKLSASDIRLSLIANDNNWQSLVAAEAIDTIQMQWSRITSTKVSA
jgi:nicotinamide mononucleotide adenylyltransferase